jgi:hypothetical protein
MGDGLASLDVGRTLGFLVLRVVPLPATFALLDSQLSWRSKVAMSEQIHSSAMSPPAMR